MFKKVIISAATIVALSAVSASAADFIDYKKLTHQLKDEAKANGNVATTEDVKKALASNDWAVVDVRTAEEWAAAYIEGSQRVGREAPEKALENIVLDDEGKKLVKDKIIVVCNTASRAAIEAETFRKMGFSKVMIYALETQWMSECNPVKNKYSGVETKDNKKFGSFKTEFCAK